MIAAALKKMDLEVTPVVAYGICAICIILGAMGLLRISDSVEDIKSRAELAKIEFAFLSSIQGTEVWDTRLALSDAWREQIDANVLTGATGGVLAADIHKSLRNIAGKVGITRMKITVVPEPETLFGLDVMMFSFTGSAADWETMIELLTAIVTTHQMNVNGFSFSHSVESTAETSFFRISGLVPIKLQTVEP